MNTATQIASRPLIRPLFMNAAETMVNAERWIGVNHIALFGWWSALSQAEPMEQSFEAFAQMQYEIECQREWERREERAQREMERRERAYESRCDRDTGIARYGQI